MPAKPFEPDAFLEDAARNTGLSDFGGDSFQEPLRVLCDSLNRESNLNPVGEMTAHQQLLELLQNRLRLTEDRRQNPGIAEGRIERPLVITGLPRSCTTILHELIRQDPANRVPLTWEARYPSPPPEAATYETDPRIAETEKAYEALHAMVPELKSMVPMSGRSVIECSSFMAHEFACDLFDPTFDIPGYRDWLWQQDITETYETYRKILQHLQWHCARDRWVLKAPTHLRTLDPLLAVFPDACIVQNHRDPLLSLASVISLRITMLKPAVAEIDMPRLTRWISEDNAEWLQRGLETRRRLDQEERFFDVYFNDFQRDPIDVVTRLYAHFDLPLGDEALSRMKSFTASNPRGKHGAHEYSFEDYGLDRAEERERYASYQEHFGIESEI
jgi:hypothetical protein